ncbi:MAG: trehalose-phosphatase [Polyangiaceae bacterium]|nr:trehalose-phosphatase [Polyangiaceae bacterium]
MKHLLSPENDEVLAQLAWSRVLLAFDFDGTLAPIVADRDAARMRARTSELFIKVCSLYPCAVISGRSQSDVSARLGAAAVKYVVGNHGLEPGASLDEFEAEIAEARASLERTLAGTAGIDVEDKRYSLALHYRRSRNKRQARSTILAAVTALPVQMRVVTGKLVVNVVPERAPNKGDALLELRKAEQADTALYLGDDVTDEDVFELDQPGRLLTVRVGESRSSAAAYFLRDQNETDRLLAKLISLREKRTAA